MHRCQLQHFVDCVASVSQKLSYRPSSPFRNFHPGACRALLVAIWFVEVSENRGELSILMGLSVVNQPAIGDPPWKAPIYTNHHLPGGINDRRGHGVHRAILHTPIGDLPVQVENLGEVLLENLMACVTSPAWQVSKFGLIITMCLVI